jgi:hypothetical protein
MTDTAKPVEPAAHWGRLERKQASVESPLRGDTDDETCAHIFAGPRGRDFLDLLYRLTIDRRQRAGATDAELREAEAQRRLVADLEAMRDRGLEALAKARKTN